MTAAELDVDLLAVELAREVVPLVDRFRIRQADDGTVPDPTAADERLLRELVPAASAVFRRLGQDGQDAAFAADVRDWLAAGLGSKPNFARSRDALRPPADGEPAFFVGPAQTTNSVPPVGKRMDCFLVRRQEPADLAAVSVRYPHPKNNCQATRLLAGSAGFARGNCIVFFPENVAAPDKVSEQAYAIFFFDKFQRIHETYALPAARSVLTPESVPTASTGLDPDDCYEARGLWGYLHDYFHHQGRWPLDRHVTLKMNWFVGLLEELKVDARTVLACAEGAVPYAQAQIDMILLERVFRYPLAADATRNFDSGTGAFLYSWFREHEVFGPAGDRFVLDRDRAVAACAELVHTIEAMEARVDTEDDYRTAARELVRRYLPEGEPGQRYRFTGDQSVLLRARRDLDRLPPLEFGATGR